MRPEAITQLCFFVTGLLPPLWGNSPAALEVNFPHYDKAGRLHWELGAKEIELVQEKTYLAKMPVVRVLDGYKTVSRAYSNEGKFDLEHKTASGEANLRIVGEGFSADGKNWTFEDLNLNTESRSKFAFSEQSRVGFEHEVGSELLAGSGPVTPSSQVLLGGSSVHEKKNTKEKGFPTTARAQRFELIDLGHGRHEILLEHDVEIRMEFTEENGTDIQVAIIECNEAKVSLGGDKNSTKRTLGKIVRIHAVGQVVLKQPGRSCFSDKLLWEAKGGQVFLEGNASVSDQRWGIASGERIILRKEDGRAEVKGGQGARSSLSLPPLPEFSFPRWLDGGKNN